jgi:P-type Cu+ transporter
MIERVFDVSGMHCQSCVGLIRDEVSEVAGVASVSVDLAAGTAIVRFDPSLAGDAEIVAAVEAAGYTASPR